MTDKLQKKYIAQVEKTLGVHFRNKIYLLTCFSHSSYAHENKTESNERLEFLGDSVLGLVISERLYGDQKLAHEGRLSQMRSRIVSEEPLAKVCKELGWDKFLRLGAGESKSEPSRSMIADLVEAVIGAVYLDQGFKTAKKFVLRHFEKLVSETELEKRVADSKSYLQEKYFKIGVKYKTEISGLAHEPWFESKVFVGGKFVASGNGQNKRTAEKNAAAAAIEILENKEKQSKKPNKNKKRKYARKVKKVEIQAN